MQMQRKREITVECRLQQRGNKEDDNCVFKMHHRTDHLWRGLKIQKRQKEEEKKKREKRKSQPATNSCSDPAERENKRTNHTIKDNKRTTERTKRR